ncbi:MAG: T9SS type A sorting domain-containing protein [Bacteroidales bacterium]|nr:T9SS type A sorting domain-containing protein [Bacteroidales bacterium]
MKYSLIIASILLLCWHPGALAQSCLPEGITFSTQSQIDSFQINYPGCTEIEGDVIIEGSSINDLSPLIVVTNIGGYLNIGNYNVGTASLKDLAGLDSLVSIGSDLIIVNNQRLNDLTGLRGITSIAGYLRILGNDSLENLVGLENISSVGEAFHIWYTKNLYNTSGLESLIAIEGDFSVIANDKLKNFLGLENLVSIGGWFHLEWNDSLDCFMGLENLDSIHGNFIITTNHTLSSLSGLNNLTSIGGGLSFHGNDTLENLSGLQNLTSIGGALYIQDNDNLVSLSGLDNINSNSITNLGILENPILTTCDVQSVCDYLVSPNGSVNIYGNAGGCNNPAQIANSCGTVLPCLPYGNYYFLYQSEIDNFQTDYPDCSELNGDVLISGDDISNLSGLSVILSVEDDLIIVSCDPLINLTGLENVISVGGELEFEDNSALASIAELYNLDSIGNDLTFENNNSLVSLTGLNNVTCIGGDLWIEDNNALNSLTELDNLYSIGNDLTFMNNNALVNLTGLENITHIGGYLWVKDNNALNSLTGLDNLISIGGGLGIFSNDHLSSLAGLDNIDSESISDMYVKDNSSLSTCHVQSVCDYIASPNGNVSIHDNALGCNSPEEVQDSCIANGVNIDEKNILNKIELFPNPSSSEITISGVDGIIGEISIYNKLGQRVIHEMKPDNTIDVSWLPRGLYIVEVIWDGCRFRKKLIVQ